MKLLFIVYYFTHCYPLPTSTNHLDLEVVNQDITLRSLLLVDYKIATHYDTTIWMLLIWLQNCYPLWNNHYMLLIWLIPTQCLQHSYPLLTNTNHHDLEFATHNATLLSLFHLFVVTLLSIMTQQAEACDGCQLHDPLLPLCCFSDCDNYTNIPTVKLLSIIPLLVRIGSNHTAGSDGVITRGTRTVSLDLLGFQRWTCATHGIMGSCVHPCTLVSTVLIFCNIMPWHVYDSE